LAILPANVLLTDISSEWLRLAIPLVLQRDLATSVSIITSIAGDQSSVYQLGGTETLRVTIEERSGEFEIDSTIRDVATQRNRRSISVQGSDLLSELNGLAKQIDTRASQFSTRSQKALEAFSAGISSADVQLKTQKLRDAIAADPSFGAAYCALANALASVHSPDALTILNTGESRRASFTVLDQAQFDLVQAKLRSAPLDKQVESARALVKLTPNDADATAALASALFLEGQSGEAERLMTHAIQINPENPAFHQLSAVGLMENRQFAQAEKVLSGLTSNPLTFSQMAFCVLLAGNNNRANGLYEKFLTTVTNPAAKIFLQASWQTFTGHLDEAIHQLGAAHFGDPRLTALARNQIVLWEIMAKRFADAKVTAIGAGPVAVLLASGAPTAEAWRSKVDAFSDQNAKDTLRAYGLFLYGFYAQAAESWNAIEMASGGTDLRARTMLAASLRLAGKTEQARKILVQPFVPDFSDYYAAVSFTQLRLLLGQAG
jgi:Flp pilus assembly protein TadD